MLTVTRSAWARLAKLQVSLHGAPVLRLRLVAGQIECFAGAYENLDQVIRSSDTTLVLSPRVAQRLAGLTLDTKETRCGLCFLVRSTQT